MYRRGKRSFHALYPDFVKARGESDESGQKPENNSEEFPRHPSYGDGGMAAAVRVASRFDMQTADNEEV